jgi:DnaK suppressor protein
VTKASASSSKAAATAKPATKSAKAATTAAPAAKKAPAIKQAETKAAKPPAQAPAKVAEAAVSAKPVAAGRSTSKISTSDNMPSPATKVDTKLANAWKNKPGRELTEAELMAMPEAEYMSDKQLDFFRARLEAQKEDLLSNAGETTEHLREDTSIVPDPADRATIEEEHALELRTRDRERKLLKKISQALVRIDAGEYGFCDETGEPIGLGRLLARPTATLSLEAQQRRELKQKMFGD